MFMKSPRLLTLGLSSLVFAAAAVSGGCCASSKNLVNNQHAVPSAAKPFLAGTEWQLVSLDGELVPGADTVTLAISAEGRVSGRAAVNRYMGSVTEEEGGAVAFKLGGMTMMAGPEPMMKLERRYLDLMPKVTRATLVDGRLVLDTAEKPGAAIFSRVQP